MCEPTGNNEDLISGLDSVNECIMAVMHQHAFAGCSHPLMGSASANH